MRKIPFRQIHMDFHTSPYIEGIGENFDADEFAKTLKAADVESINLFAKCHHGMYYYPTKLGKVHPNMKTNLLKEQLDACKREGINALIYTCVGWSEDTAHTHPEWQEVSIDGVIGSRKPFTRPYTSWQKLCLNNKEYRDYMKAEFKEIYELFKPYGFWIDIIFQNQCICGTCISDMRNNGLDPEKLTHRYKNDRRVQIEYMHYFYEYIKSLDEDLHIYFNGHPYEMDLSDDLKLAAANKRQYNTFIDIESLPSQMWGYSHFPIAVNYVNKYDIDITMMNGKFHTSWGDFGSLRNKEALEYECFRAIANGAGCCIGDQLHPSGKIDDTVYKRIGEVFASVKAKEKWCKNTKKIAQIGVFNTRRSGVMSPNDHNIDLPVEGVYRMLTELHYTYDILNLQDDISKYDLLILPDNVYLDNEASDKIAGYLRNGGKVIASCKSGLDFNEKNFLLDDFGVKYVGEAQFNPRYMEIKKEEFPQIPEMTYVTYEQGLEVRERSGANVLSKVINPYFNRGEVKFCSHRHTPPTKEPSETPAIIENGNVIYISNPIFTDYAKNRCKVYKEIVENLILRLGVVPRFKGDLPSYVEVSLRQINQSIIIHILNYIIEKKSHTIDTIEEITPLFNRRIYLKTDKRPIKILNIDAENGIETELDFNWDGCYVTFILSEIGGHTMIEVVI